MSRFSKILLLLTVAAGIAVPVALGDSPHFVSASGSVGSNGALTVNFKEAGLGNNVTVNYSASADASAVYGCFNGGGNHPKATNKETVTAPVSGGGSFTSGRNGSITASITLSNSPPGPGDFTCPSGQTLRLISVSYTNIVLTDTTNGISVNLPNV